MRSTCTIGLTGITNMTPWTTDLKKLPTEKWVSNSREVGVSVTSTLHRVHTAYTVSKPNRFQGVALFPAL